MGKDLWERGEEICIGDWSLGGGIVLFAWVGLLCQCYKVWKSLS